MSTRGITIMALFLAAMMGLILAGGGCAEKITGPGTTAKVTVGFGLKAGPAVSYRLTVTATDMDTLTSFMAVMGNQVVAILDIPAGPDRHFLTEALDLNGTVMYSGQVTVDVSSLIPLDLTIDMLPVVPMIYLIPHFSEVRTGQSFTISLCANELEGLLGIGMGFSLRGFGKLDYTAVIDTALIDPGLAEQGISLFYQRNSPDDIYFEITSEVQPIVDEKGDGCLIDIQCRTQDTWSADSLFITPQMFIEYTSGLEMGTNEIFLDSSRFLVIRNRHPESYLGTSLDDDGIALAPGNGETVLAGSNNMNNDPPPELYLAGLGSGTEPNWTSTIIWPKRERTTGLARSATGGFFACGSNSFSGGSIYRLDGVGAELWRVETSYEQDMPLAVAARPDGGCFVVGAMPAVSGFGRGYFIAAHDADGASQGKSGSQGSTIDQELRSVVTQDQSTLMSAGWIRDFDSGSDVLLVRDSPPFNTGRLTRQFGGSGDQSANDLIKLSNGDLLVVGYADSLFTGNRDLYVARTDPEGKPLWARSFGSPNLDEIGMAVTPTPDGRFVAAGSVGPVQGNRDVYLVKFDGGGNLVWENILGGSGDDYARDIRADGNGFIATGSTTPGPFGQTDILVLRLNSAGEKIDSP